MDDPNDLPGALYGPLLAWYAAHARELPWRGERATPWSVMVSEFMLQQTPVSRVEPVHRQWLETWPTPAALAAAPSGEAVRAWGRLGYPRRALRLHAAATAIVERYGGQVPSAYDDLLALPGVGDYTATAIATFGFGRRHAVLDTNVRRVLARAVTGVELPPVTTTAAEKRLAASLLPEDEADAATWSIALMELGALVCTAAKPRCDRCPIADRCAWRAAGYPAYDGPPRRAQTWAGTDRQCRGRLLAVVRDADGSVTKSALDRAWDDPDQRARCLQSLLDDGLLVVAPEGYALPG
jgi:A/G-specific adenine glycosylase